MNTQTQTLCNDLIELADEARALMAATVDVAGEEVVGARKRVAAVLARSAETYGQIRAKAVLSAKAADQAVRNNPYQAVAVGVGLGALVGLLVSRTVRRQQ